MRAAVLQFDGFLPRAAIAPIAAGGPGKIVSVGGLVATSTLLVTSRRFNAHVDRLARRQGCGHVIVPASEIAPAAIAILQAGLAHAVEMSGLMPAGLLPTYRAERMKVAGADGILVTATLALEARP